MIMPKRMRLYLLDSRCEQPFGHFHMRASLLPPGRCAATLSQIWRGAARKRAARLSTS